MLTLADWIAWEKHATPYNDLVLKFGEQGRSFMAEIDEEVQEGLGMRAADEDPITEKEVQR